MPRMARAVIPGVAHHVTQRGNRREAVFFDDCDRQKYCQLLLEHAPGGVATLAYCLMPNHVHFICIPAREDALSAAFGPVNLCYTQYINWRHELTGRLWQGRFYSCSMDEPHLWAAIRYVERNPVRAKLVARAEDYPWSSARAHCGQRHDPIVAPLPSEICIPASQWSGWLAEEDNEAMLAALRQNTSTGRPAGDESFIQKLEALTGRPLRAPRIGRPSKKVGTPPTFLSRSTLQSKEEVPQAPKFLPPD